MQKRPDQDRMDWIESELFKLEKLKPGSKRDIYALYQLVTLFFEQLTGTSHVAFTSLFSRMVYAFVHYKFDSKLVRANHWFRRRFESGLIPESDASSFFDQGIHIMWHNLAFVSSVSIPEAYTHSIASGSDSVQPSTSYSRITRCLVLDCIETAEGVSLRFYSEEEAHILREARISNKAFAIQVLKLKSFVPMPFPASLVDVTEGPQGLELSSFVYKPDFLVGVTTISECFQSGGTLAITALAKKLIPTGLSRHLLMGNVVNYIFDELIHDIGIKLEDLLSRIFRNAAVEFAMMHDEDLKEFLEKMKIHFTNLRRLVGKELEETGISPSKALLEPSFYSSEYGLQGRLDLYHFNPEERHSHIVELKSGKLFRPNSYGLNENHYVQTLLYDLLIESVHSGRVKSNNYILYSYLDEQNLKYAPKLRTKQLEAIQVRNDIVLLEDLLSSGDMAMVSKLLSYLNPSRIPENFNFLSRDARQFLAIYDGLTATEKSYYQHFISFINREYQLSKTGEHGLYASNGLASLWLDTTDDKLEKFMILAKLRIIRNEADADNPLITLAFTDDSSRMSRFRIGDIAVMYPDGPGVGEILAHQIYKCSIVMMDADTVTVRLRARQKNHEAFDVFSSWNLEADSLDSGFLKQYHGLFSFIASNPAARRMLMGIDPPGKPMKKASTAAEFLSKQQQEILDKAISARDYFLLWGPPGTGKTSVMLRALVEHYHNESDSNILLLAYTNKAVDEICESVENVLGKNYIRVGSRYSTGENYQPRLLSQVLETADHRSDVLRIIKSHRVFVSTLSSFQGREALIRLKQFDLVIIDEASQILEPMLVGLLPQFGKFILIGDHKQLPAVVAQKKELCQVEDDELKESCGLEDMSDSLFERLFRRCQAEGWNWAFATLENQGRMHRDILRFVSPAFYDSRLGIIEGIDRLEAAPGFKAFDKLSETLVHQRMIFVDTPIDDSVTHKTNQLEAKLLARILSHWIRIYDYNSGEVNAGSFGIITPFRSQIALLRQLVEDGVRDFVSIDTVERYQGGSRDHIFISLAVSKAQLLDSISNISSEGIDRKLNVALTRARENVVIFGNGEILSQNPLYRSLIEHCYSLSYLDIEDNPHI